MEPAETMVRMGELAVSRSAGHVLVAFGLGSCIGLALLDRRLGIAGLAHIVLPQSGDGAPAATLRKFADHAVPELIEELQGIGARPVRLEAVLVGGASMFATGPSSLEVGQRNDAAVRELMRARRIPILASATGGSRGRTVHIDVETTGVTVREAGAGTSVLVEPARVLEKVAA
jgi:chemotaxis protein CheD